MGTEAWRSSLLKARNVIFEILKTWPTLTKYFHGLKESLFSCQWSTCRQVNWLQISFGTTSLSELSFWFFTSLQIWLTPTMIGWLSLPIITKLLRVSKDISDSLASMPSSEISSTSISPWSSAAVWRENRLLICCAILHSSGLKVGSPFSFLRVFI